MFISGCDRREGNAFEEDFLFHFFVCLVGSFKPMTAFWNDCNFGHYNKNLISIKYNF